MVFRAVVFKLLVCCGAEGYVSRLQDVALAASCKRDYPLQFYNFIVSRILIVPIVVVLTVTKTAEETKQHVFYMFCWPCISIYLCNKNQLDVLFILSLFRQSSSTCFGHICSPSSGGILYIYNKLVRIVMKRGMFKINRAYLHIIIMCQTYCCYLHLLNNICHIIMICRYAQVILNIPLFSTTRINLLYVCVYIYIYIYEGWLISKVFNCIK